MCVLTFIHSVSLNGGQLKEYEMSVGPARVSEQSKFMQFETHDFPGCKHTTTASTTSTTDTAA